MKNLTLVKLGGSLITDKSKPFTEKKLVIKRLAREIHQARKKSKELIIVGHGGGSYPHVPARDYRTAEGVLNKDSYKGISLVQDAASQLNRIVVKELLLSDENAISMSPSSMMTSDKGRPNKIFLDSLEKSLKFEMLPVFYGDVVFDSSKGCTIFSTEIVLEFLAIKLASKYKVKKIIYCGMTDGVYDATGKTVEKITPKNFKLVKKQITGSAGIDVTGGMLHKVVEALNIAKKGITSVIINGEKKGNLFKALTGVNIKSTVISKN